MTKKAKPIIQTIDQPKVTPVSTPDQSLPLEKTASKKKINKTFLALSILISILLFLVVLSLFLKPQSQNEPIDTITPTPTQEIQITSAPETNSLEQKIESIHQEIQNKQILSLPNISLDITL